MHIPVCSQSDFPFSESELAIKTYINPSRVLGEMRRRENVTDIAQYRVAYWRSFARILNNATGTDR